MAEIKSTLDLIMEKTRNLTMTEEERQALHRKELEGKTRGWIERYRNGLTELMSFRETLPGKPVDDVIMCDILGKEALKSLQPGKDNEKFLLLLEEILGMDTEPIRHHIDAFLHEREKEMLRHAQDSLGRLEDMGVRGSAVMPNLEKDQAWQTWQASSRTEFSRALAASALKRSV